MITSNDYISKELEKGISEDIFYSLYGSRYVNF